MSLSLVPPTDPVLWTPAEPVTDIATQVLPHVDDLWNLMRAHRGTGLAAPQVGIPLTFFMTVADQVVINPQILGYSEETDVDEEGCLSFPGLRALVKRPRSITATWLNPKGKTEEAWIDGWIARVWQHEADHLRGRLIFPRPISLDTTPQAG